MYITKPGEKPREDPPETVVNMSIMNKHMKDLRELTQRGDHAFNFRIHPQEEPVDNDFKFVTVYNLEGDDDLGEI